MEKMGQLRGVLVALRQVSVQTGGNALLENIDLTIHTGEQWAIIGHSGSGKTTLAHVLAGKLFYRGELQWQTGIENSRVELVEQQHHFKNLRNTSSFYYQQRFNASEADDSNTVADALGVSAAADSRIGLLHLDSLMPKPLLQLSNGENKRLQLAKALLANPGLLILDNPFLGLDTEGRKTLHQVFDKICSNGIQLVLITSSTELPACITHVAVLEKGKLVTAQEKRLYVQQQVEQNTALRTNTLDLCLQLQQPAEADFEYAVKMERVYVQYGEKIVLDDISWQVKKGECWNLSGPNGSGKSTLLSLITADNPQAYANKIILFDKRRGTGESIWDIKGKIGFVSPELHLYFEQHATCFEVIASGLFDTIGLFRNLCAAQEEKVVRWMRLMNLTEFKQKRVFQLSASQQRMALLARALVKNPPLLILDEPTQGLDETQTAYFKELVNEVCRSFKTTLIYVTHYTSDLPACISHYLKLSEGKMVNS
ncbi:MAG: ATP-binding cassette domain-containing protein [Bacteroidota bacterium]